MSSIVVRAGCDCGARNSIASRACWLGMHYEEPLHRSIELGIPAAIDEELGLGIDLDVDFDPPTVVQPAIGSE